MEKYRKFADHGTGIYPFVPVVETRKYSATSKVLKYFNFIVVAPLLLVLRLPLALITGVIGVVLGVLLPALVGFILPPLGRLLRVVILAPCARLLLVLSGFWGIPVTKWPILAPHLQEKGLKECAGSGSVIFSNLTSFVDILIHTSRFAPLFGFALEVDGKPRVVTKGALGACLFLAKGPRAAYHVAESSGVSLEAAIARARQHRAPLLLFFEGTTTNGKGVLAPPPKLLSSLPVEDKKGVTVLVTATMYTHDGSVWCPTQPIGSLLTHWIAMASRLSHSVKCIDVLPSRTPQYSQIPDDDLYVKQVVAKLCEASGLRQMTLSAAAKDGFITYWTETQGGYRGGPN